METIFLKTNSKCANLLQDWAVCRHMSVKNYTNNSTSEIDGLIVILENDNLDKETSQIFQTFQFNRKPVYKIDLNGTMSAVINNLNLWLELNHCQKIMIQGSSSILSNPNLERYLNNIT